MKNTLLDNLNNAQTQAVTATSSQQLVLAGAGSGKTRVLVHRIAWLIHECDVSPHSILAVTFTNKAAGEMRHRVESLLQMPTSHLWIGTFHGLAHRLLRMHWQEAKLGEEFQILDADDQYRIIRRLLRNLNLDEKQWSPKTIQWFINSKKDEGLRAHQCDPHDDYVTEKYLQIYRAYEQHCEQAQLVDFAELLFRTLELLRDNPNLLNHYQQRFKHILVDEFQDTNTIQYAWLKLLAGDNNAHNPVNHVMIVGDDDQSIYGWRGAKVENLHKFCNDYPQAEVIKLEENYRSTGNILEAANTLIANNGQRLGKNLWTQGGEGEPIAVYAAFNELDEARFIAHRIEQYYNKGERLRDIAILYRSNALSRVLEEALLQARLPYRIYGGMRYFERAEIKDALAYMRLISNHDNDTAYERIVNVPPRGIGEKTIETIRQQARENNQSLWQATLYLIEHKQLSARAITALQQFIELILEIKNQSDNRELWQQTEIILEQTELLAYYSKDKTEKGRAKKENLEELITATRTFVPEEQDMTEAMTPMAAFLAHAALEAGEGQAGAHEDAVQMMTLHAAKGLEFPTVFISGLEEGVFPSYFSVDDQHQEEEERRLCYVGITRAKKRLHLSYAENRRLYGKQQYHKASRFITELPDNLIQQVRLRNNIERPSNLAQTSLQNAAIGDTGFSLGQAVMHPKYGKGIILNFEGSGPHARIQVNFSSHGAKWLVIAYANLQSLD